MLQVGAEPFFFDVIYIYIYLSRGSTVNVGFLLGYFNFLLGKLTFLIGTFNDTDWIEGLQTGWTCLFRNGCPVMGVHGPAMTGMWRHGSRSNYGAFEFQVLLKSGWIKTLDTIFSDEHAAVLGILMRRGPEVLWLQQALGPCRFLFCAGGALKRWSG